MDTAIHATTVAPARLVPLRAHWLLFVANAAALIAVLVVLFTVPVNTSTFRVGGVASDTIVAQRTVVYVDHVATVAHRQQAVLAVPTQYMTDSRQATQRQRQAAAFLAGAGHVLAENLTPAQKLTALRALLPPGVSAAALQEFPNLSLSDFRVVQARSLSLLAQAVAWRFDSNQASTIELALLSTIPSEVTLPQRTAIGEVLDAFLFPTRVPDLAATQAKQRQATARVPEVTDTIPAGQVVVRRGDLITKSVMEKLAALGLQTRHTGWRDVASSLLFAAVIITTLFWYLHAFHGSILANARLLLLVDASILITVAGAQILTPGHVLLPFFLPVAGASTLAAVLIAPEACLAIAFATSVLAGWIVANSFELTTYYFLSSVAGVLAVRHVRQLKQFVFAGASISMFALATALSFGIVDQNYDLAALQEYVLASAFNGFVSATLAFGGFALLAGFFGVTTMLQLLELGQPNQPLLRRLTIKAPGTYNHSLIVASMVERAADEVGANALVAKVGALYHDVGKTMNPHCFVENQLGIGNIHDELRPEESARIIRGHVVQGIRLAHQYKLPRVVLDAIGEHHGTMTIAYFLHRARQVEGDVDPSLYRYPGPKPQSKETALLLLADGCESAVRAAHDHSHETIQTVVYSIFEERIQQGQLDESPLTLQDVQLAKTAFCAVLNGLYHPRIEYPEPFELPLDAPLPESSSAVVRSLRGRHLVRETGRRQSDQHTAAPSGE